MSRKGFTLLEILVSVILLAMMITGLTEVFISARRFALHNRSRMAAAQMSKTFLDYLYMHVRADTWDTSPNDLSNTTVALRYCGYEDRGYTQQNDCFSEVERTLDNVIYKANYTIVNEFNLRRVTLRVTWNETAKY
ncbi:MAG: type II secretion system protein [Candidatus Omnitrophota bacterium]